jgi:hypothetical protein
VPPPDYFPIKHQHGPNGHFTQGISLFSFRQGFTHKISVVHGAFLLKKTILPHLV